MTVSVIASEIYKERKSFFHGSWNWREQWSKAMKEAVIRISRKINTAFQKLFTKQESPMLAERYSSKKHSIAGWLMSEKFNGVRAIWDGENLKSRNGNIFHAPAWFVAGLPEGVIIEGELWMGIDTLAQVISEVKKINGDWTGIHFLIFDAVIDGVAHRNRMEIVRSLSLPDWCDVVEQVVCESAEHLNRFHDQVKANGGEGVVLKNPEAYYQYERTGDFLKVKDADTDEAAVTGYRMGTGRFAGQVRSLICKFNGKIFVLNSGLNKEVRKNPPRRGEKVTFEYYGLTKAGKPNHAVFLVTRDYE